MMMSNELLCSEAGLALDAPIAAVDHTLLQDRRVLDNMIALQTTTLPSDTYLTDPATDLQPSMRKIVTNWMLEVCDDNHCENQVFLVAVNLLDRFLNTTPVKRSQLQLSACVCLLLASKLRQCSYLSVELLAFYTENCVTKEELRQWEVLVVAKLRWDLCPVTAIDFIEVLLQQMSIQADLRAVRRHSAVLIALSATEMEFISSRPSCIAGAAIVASIQGLTHSNSSSMGPCIQSISAMLRCSPDSIHSILVALEESVKRATNAIDGNTGGDTASCNTRHQEQYSKLRAMMEEQGEELIDTDGKETPVDVLDIHF